MNSKEFYEKYPVEKVFGVVNIAPAVVYGVKGEIPKNQRGINRLDYIDFETIISANWKVYLDDNYDDLVIGSVEEAKQFYKQFPKDLAEAIKYCEENPIVL